MEPVPIEDEYIPNVTLKRSTLSERKLNLGGLESARGTMTWRAEIKTPKLKLENQQLKQRIRDLEKELKTKDKKIDTKNEIII